MESDGLLFYKKKDSVQCSLWNIHIFIGIEKKGRSTTYKQICDIYSYT